jgi:hypothetical protein
VKRIFLFIAAVVTAVLGSIGLWAGVAAAWQPVLYGQTTCMSNGGWTVDWTVTNHESGAMTLVSTVNGVPISLIPSSVLPGAWAAGTSTQTYATEVATLDVTARWANSHEIVSRSLPISRPDDCVAPTTTTTTVAPTTTTTVAPTTTTEPPVTTTAPAVTTTVQVDATTVVSTPVSHPVPMTPAPAVEAVQVNTLPVTGTVSVPLLVSGAGLLLFGVGLVVVARRCGPSI